MSIKVLSQEEIDSKIEELWMNLVDVPFDEDSDGELILAEPWHIFKKGTTRTNIWHWFDEYHSKGVGWLLYEFDG